MISRIIAATGNPDKLKEIRMMFPEQSIPIISMSEIGIVTDFPETGSSFQENAIQKAEGLFKLLQKRGDDLKNTVIMADDTGLCVDALHGEPGIFSARYGEEGSTAEERIRLVLRKMKDVSKEQRTGYCISAVACIFPNGSMKCAEGVLPCRIPSEPKGTRGFGYDPIVYVPEYQKTLAQITDEEKREISHRGKALRAIWEIIVNS